MVDMIEDWQNKIFKKVVFLVRKNAKIEENKEGKIKRERCVRLSRGLKQWVAK